MPSRVPFYAGLATLVLAGAVLAWLRHAELGVPWLPGEDRPVWLVEARVDFRADGEPVLVSLDLPRNPPGFEVVSEQAASPGFGFSMVEEEGDRRGEWSVREASGLTTLYYKAQVVRQSGGDDSGEAPPPQQDIEPVFWEEPQATAASELLADARRHSSTPESLARELIKRLSADRPDQNTRLLLDTRAKARILKQLLNQAEIPARLATGLRLEDARRRQQLQTFVELYNGEQWRFFDPESGEQGVPDNLLLWQRGTKSLLDVMGGQDSRVSFSILRQTVPSLGLASSSEPLGDLGLFGLYQLPIEEQGMFRILLLLPLGALVVAFMRIMVGVPTSGTFMPVLIAVAFLQTSLLPGVLTFVTIVALGLLLRGYLSLLNLLLVARISALIILVIFLTSVISVVGYGLGLNPGNTITFFPIVILAWTIERLSILWEEESAQEVLKQGGGSLVVAVLAYLLMQDPVAGHLSFNFPELHLIVLAAILFMGQYTGYRLTELHRFRAMSEPD